VVLLDIPGDTYWSGWDRFLEEEVGPKGLVSADDRALFIITDDIDEATSELLGFYRNYQSCRWVGNLLVIRMLVALDKAELASLNRRFGDIVDGPIRHTKPFAPERSGNDHLDQPRLALRFDRIHYGRLRQMIDALNLCTGGGG